MAEKGGSRTMNKDLKPCRFCGRGDSSIIGRYKSGGEWWYFVECGECMAIGPVGKTEQYAVDAWNEGLI